MDVFAQVSAAWLHEVNDPSRPSPRAEQSRASQPVITGHSAASGDVALLIFKVLLEILAEEEGAEQWLFLEGGSRERLATPGCH